MAAPLLTTTTLLPGGSGLSSASRSQLNAILTSVFQFDGERLPRLMLEWTHHWVGAGDQDDNLRVVLVQQVPRHSFIGGVGDLCSDVRVGGGQLGKRGTGSGDRDH
jgi:hypothetical protein